MGKGKKLVPLDPNARPNMTPKKHAQAMHHLHTGLPVDAKKRTVVKVGPAAKQAKKGK